MNPTGHVRCRECRLLLRGYAPRGWKPGDELCPWLHLAVDDAGNRGPRGRRSKCPGSYQPGTDTRLDEGVPTT